jgi:hypothetical protein
MVAVSSADLGRYFNPAVSLLSQVQTKLNLSSDCPLHMRMSTIVLQTLNMRKDM